MRYKIGDKVKVREDLIVGRQYGGDCFVEGMKELLGKVVEISDVFREKEYTVRGNLFGWTDEMIEGKVKSTMTKSDLKTGMIVTTESGQEYWVMKNNVSGIDAFVNIKTGGYNNFTSYTEELNSKSCLGGNIIKIEIPHAPNVTSRRTLLWEREEVKKVTMKQIEEKFGCKVEIVNEG